MLSFYDFQIEILRKGRLKVLELFLIVLTSTLDYVNSVCQSAIDNSESIKSYGVGEMVVIWTLAYDITTTV